MATSTASSQAGRTVRSSRQLEREANRNVELMWLLRRLTPDFKTIADFRKDNAQAIRGVCREFIAFCRELRLFGGELVAIDGSKFKAVNARNRNFSARKLKNQTEEMGHRPRRVHYRQLTLTEQTLAADTRQIEGTCTTSWGWS
jgi:hypothetical protein